MKFHVVVDIATNAAGAVVINRIIPIDSSYVYIAYGPCTLLSSSVCFYAYGIMVMGATMTILIVFVSFVVRLQIIRNRKPSNRHIIALLLLLTFPGPTVMMVLFLACRSVDSEMRGVVQSHLPNYAHPNATIFGIRDIRTPAMSVSLTLMIAGPIPVYFGILMLRSRILKCLDETGDFLSLKTKTMHAQFVQMLTRQCITPPVVFFARLVPLQLEYFDLIRHPLLEAMVNVLVRLSALLSPLIVLFHIAPYRRALFRWIKRSKISSLRSATYSARLLLDDTVEHFI